MMVQYVRVSLLSEIKKNAYRRLARRLTFLL